MRNDISVQLLTFGQSILLGAGIALLYDLLRPLRLRHSRLTWLTDGAYCLTALLAVFLFLLRRVEGIPRLYVLLGLAGGGVLFFSLLSAPLRPIWDFWADTAAWGLHLLAIPLKKTASLCKKFGFHCKNLFYFGKKCYTIRKTGGYSSVFKRRPGTMAKTAKKSSKVKAGFFTKVLILVLLGALGSQLYHLHSQVAEAQAQKDALSYQVAEQQQTNDQLQAGIDNGGSEEEMKRIAREELGLVDPNEKVFYDTSN